MIGSLHLRQAMRLVFLIKAVRNDGSRLPNSFNDVHTHHASMAALAGKSIRQVVPCPVFHL